MVFVGLMNGEICLTLLRDTVVEQVGDPVVEQVEPQVGDPLEDEDIDKEMEEFAARLESIDKEEDERKAVEALLNGELNPDEWEIETPKDDKNKEKLERLLKAARSKIDCLKSQANKLSKEAKEAKSKATTLEKELDETRKRLNSEVTNKVKAAAKKDAEDKIVEITDDEDIAMDGGIQCGECGSVYETLRELKVHVNTEHQKHKCDHCLKEFSNMVELMNHKKKENHIQDFECVCVTTRAWMKRK